jgi:hypothetical protein
VSSDVGRTWNRTVDAGCPEQVGLRCSWRAIGAGNGAEEQGARVRSLISDSLRRPSRSCCPGASSWWRPPGRPRRASRAGEAGLLPVGSLRQTVEARQAPGFSPPSDICPYLLKTNQRVLSYPMRIKVLPPRLPGKCRSMSFAVEAILGSTWEAHDAHRKPARSVCTRSEPIT